VVRIWDTREWRELYSLAGHTLTVVQLEFSHDDRFLASVSRDRHVAIFARDESAAAGRHRRGVGVFSVCVRSGSSAGMVVDVCNDQVNHRIDWYSAARRISALCGGMCLRVSHLHAAGVGSHTYWVGTFAQLFLECGRYVLGDCIS